MVRHQPCEIDLDNLIEVWKVLEILTVSLDRLGMYWLQYGESEAKNALHDFMTPVMAQKIANARSLTIDILETCDSSIPNELEVLSEVALQSEYWDGPNTLPDPSKRLNIFAKETTKMTLDQRRQQIAIYGSAYDMLKNAMERYPREMWQYRPTPQDFTIHEILVHITDSEANSFVRARRFIAESGSGVLGYDEFTWASKLNYHAQSVDDAVELFRWLRGNTYKLIRDLPEEVWGSTVVHSENGVMTMDEWLDVYTRHVPEHVAQMERVYQTWRAGK